MMETFDDIVRDASGKLAPEFIAAVREALETIELETLYSESKTTADGVAKMLVERGVNPEDVVDVDAVQQFLRSARSQK